MKQAERAEYVREHITDHIASRHHGETPGLKWMALSPDDWKNLAELSAIDRVSGWTSPVLEDDSQEQPLIVRFCPEVIAATTAHLTLSPEPGGHRPWTDLPVTGIESFTYADNYLRCLEDILDMEVVYWRISDPALRRQAAEADLYADNPAKLQLVSMVQSAALWAVTG